MEDRGYQTIRVEVAKHVATLTIDRPEKKNAIGPVTVNELLWALDDAKEDSEVRAVVLTGAGKVFSAGGDLSQMAGGDGPALEPKGDFKDLLLRFTSLGKPTIARIPGVARGGALGLIASCDFAVAAQSATLGTPEIRRGLFPMMIMAPLARVVPRRELMRMMLLGDKLTATEALRIGIVSDVVPDDKLDAATEALGDKLAAQSPTAMRMGLAAFHAQADQALAESLPYLQEQLGAILGTEDAREGLSAFLQKREPVWTGR
jgi:enoyl-CoA hydratase/carnithine racemase